MKIVITGAGGFVGSRLAEQLYEKYEKLALTLTDTKFANVRPLAQRENTAIKKVRYVEGDLQDSVVRENLLVGGVDILYHLASLPGGASEANPALSKSVNLISTLSLIEEVAALDRDTLPRVVFTSTIAVLGNDFPALVDDTTPIAPAMIYGAHKAMGELALADMSRRNIVDAVSVRLPGVVARPLASSGLKSAFLSNVFHALRKGETFVCPISASATFWIMSLEQCVANLLHAATLDSQLMPASRAVTLPALRCTMSDMCEEIARQCGVTADLVSYAPDTDLEKHFGTYPPLVTPAADHAGFSHDCTVADMVMNVLKNID